jgi:hypothetical protein
MSLSDSAPGFVIAFIFDRVWSSPVTFFNTAARGWVIDEDCLEMPGRRREAMYLSVMHVIDNVAGIGVQMIVAGSAWTGLDTTACFGDAQDPAAVDYIKNVFLIITPVLHLSVAVFIVLFPIHGGMSRSLFFFHGWKTYFE